MLFRAITWFTCVQRSVCHGGVGEILFSYRHPILHPLTRSLKATGRLNGYCDLFHVTSHGHFLPSSWNLYFISARDNPAHILITDVLFGICRAPICNWRKISSTTHFVCDCEVSLLRFSLNTHNHVHVYSTATKNRGYKERTYNHRGVQYYRVLLYLLNGPRSNRLLVDKPCQFLYKDSSVYCLQPTAIHSQILRQTSIAMFVFSNPINFTCAVESITAVSF